MEEVLHSVTQSMVEPSGSQESRAAQETAVTKKKRGKRREQTRKAKENQATQTDDRLPEKTTVTTGTQTRFLSTWNKSTQTPGPRLAREPLSYPQAQAAPTPSSSPSSAQAPAPNPIPSPSSAQAQAQAPAPNPIPSPSPSSAQAPAPAPNPVPYPAPSPSSAQAPAPAPNPVPSPSSAQAPAPAPNPVPSPAPSPSSAQAPAPTPSPAPSPSSSPGQAPTLSPSPAPAPLSSTSSAPAPAQPPSHHLPRDQLPPSQPGSSQQPPEEPSQPNIKSKMRDPNDLFVLTWNIDGLDPEDVDERFPRLLHYLRRIRADIVLLQEIIPSIAEVMDRIMTDYEFIWGNTSGYYTGMMLLKSRVNLLQSSIVNYPTTEMGRNLLMAQLSFSGHPLWVMTSHLESCKSNSQERMNQLRRVWKRMREAPDDHTVIFGGDTNLRDREVKWLGGLPEGISDVWELLGQPENCRYTWDTVNNNNKDLPFPAQLRFDRVYVRPGKAGEKALPVSMKLVGQDQLKCGRFTSDHWGILCKFSWTHD